MAFSDRALRRAAFWNCLTDQYANVSFVWHIFLNRVLVDSVLAPTPQDDSWYSGALPTSRSLVQQHAQTVQVVPRSLVLFSPSRLAMFECCGFGRRLLFQNCFCREAQPGLNGKGSERADRTGRAILLVVLFLLPHGFIIFLYRLKAQRKILGMAVNQLQENRL